ILNETFSRVLKTNNEDIKNKKSWIFGICNNIILEQYREKYQDEDITEFDEKIIIDIESDSEKIVIDQETKELILNELKQLPKNIQEIIILKIWEGMSFEEISTILQSKIGITKMRYYRGLKKIEIRLKEKKDKK